MPTVHDLLDVAAMRGVGEVVLESRKPAVLITGHGSETVGAPIEEGELIESLTGVLSDEQQVDLAVGSVVQFTIEHEGVSWNVVAEPGADGICVRATRSDVDDDSETVCVAGLGIDLPPAVAPAIYYGQDDPVAPGYGPNPDSLSIDFDIDESDGIGGGGGQSSAPPASNPDPFADWASLDVDGRGTPPTAISVAPYEGAVTRSDIPVADLQSPERHEIGLDFSDDDEDELLDAPLVSSSAPLDATQLPELPELPDETDFSELSVDVEAEIGGNVDLLPSTAGVSVLAGPLKTGRGGMHAPSSSSNPAENLQAKRETRTDDLSRIAPKIVAGAFVFVRGDGLAKGLAELFSGIPVIVRSQGDLVGMHPERCFVIQAEDPSPFLGWMLRRVEEGSRVVVDTQASTGAGAERILLGINATQAAQSWLLAQPRYWICRGDPGIVFEAL